MDKIPIEYQPDSYLEKQTEHEVIESETKSTSKIIQQTIRIGQERFRRSLLKEIGFCPVTGITDSRILTASHIKPWRVANNSERLDKNNGFIFAPTIDKLFDIGLISFQNNKSILISKSISIENQQAIGIVNNEICENLPLENRLHYLEYHRKYIFLDYKLNH